MIDQEELAIRQAALTMAGGFLQPILEEFRPESYEMVTMPGNPFSVPPKTTMTAAEQVVNLSLDVATWLLKDGV